MLAIAQRAPDLISPDANLTMSNWNASHYLTFSSERTRAAVDLATQIRLETPGAIVDLGCGPGNSTHVLGSRWPDAHLVGIDNSAEMIEAARQSYPDQNWMLADISEWSPAKPVDLIYSNAALQWLSNHNALIPRLFQMVATSGALAFQVPSSTFATVRKLAHEISEDPAWNERMEAARNALTLNPPSFYYDLLGSQAVDIDIWETEYNHVMDSSDSIVDWISSTGLRPFLSALDNDRERHTFLSELHRRVSDAYEIRANGKVLFPFRRTFVIAYR